MIGFIWTLIKDGYKFVCSSYKKETIELLVHQTYFDGESNSNSEFSFCWSNRDKVEQLKDEGYIIYSKQNIENKKIINTFINNSNQILICKPKKR